MTASFFLMKNLDPKKIIKLLKNKTTVKLFLRYKLQNLKN